MEENKNVPHNVINNEMKDHELLAMLSPSFVNLTKGYLDYSTYIILQRAIIGIDGFKPVQRRALYTALAKTKLNKKQKSGTLISDTMLIHPHGDSSIYLTVCRMVEGTEFFQTPFFEGEGSFGKNSKGTPPAKMRYTELKLGKMSEELFKDMAGVKMIPTEDGNYKEPELLPVTFPSLFANATSGIAVGLSANIFPYPMYDLCMYTADLIEKGETDTILVPDFETGGYIVNTPKEFAKIMRTGRGRIKLRGEWVINKNDIVITKFPFYTNAPAIKKQIDKLELPEISEVIDSSDKSGAGVVVRCKKRDYVEHVLSAILRNTDIQMYATSNVVVIIDGQPKIAGVTELLQDWITFRKGVLSKSLNDRLAYIIDLQAKYRVYLDLTANSERVEELIKAIKSGGMKAEDMLKSWYPNADDTIVDWLLKLSIRNFYNPEKNRKALGDLEMEERDINFHLNNLDKLIAKQLRELANKYKRERKTIITEQDYVFTSKERDEEPVLPVEVSIKDKFVTKRTYVPTQKQEAGSFRCNSDDIIVVIDTQGRLIRIDLKRIEYTSRGSKGVYLPVFLEVEDDFNLVWASVLEDKKVGFMYRDGNVSVLDLNEWIGLRHTKRLVPQGISPEAHQICGLIDLEKKYTLIITSLGRIGVATNDFKQKDRRARTRLFKLNTNKNEVITRTYGLDDIELMKVLKNTGRYMHKVSFLEYSDDFNAELIATL